MHLPASRLRLFGLLKKALSVFFVVLIIYLIQLIWSHATLLPVDQNQEVLQMQDMVTKLHYQVHEEALALDQLLSDHSHMKESKEQTSNIHKDILGNNNVLLSKNSLLRGDAEKGALQINSLP